VIALPDDEAAHLSRVMRLAAGADVRVFDGAGAEWIAQVAEISRRHVTVRLIEPAVPAPEARIAVVLAIAVLKGDKMDEVVRDAVMLGVGAIQPLVTDRTEISSASIERSNRVARWQRIAVSSAKQCGRAVVPAVAAALTFEAWISAPRERTLLMFVEPGAALPATPLNQVHAVSSVSLLIGPEGGWADHEIRGAQAAGATLTSLGGRTLRADAMPIIALTALRTLWEDF
jgi:16S rRNA (uracil1498-N3)-methyltransferase